MAEQFVVELESRLKTDNVEKEIKNLNLRLKKTDKIVINVDGKKAIKEIQTLEDEVGRLYKRVKKPDGEDGFSKMTESIRNTNTEIRKFVNQFDGSMNTITTTTNSAGDKIRTEVREIADAFGTVTKTTQQYQEINGTFQKMGEAITVVTQDMVKYEKQAQKQLETDRLIAKEKEKLIEKGKQQAQAEKERMASVTKTTSQTERMVNGTKALVTTMTEENSLGQRITTTITEYTDSMGRAVKETQKFDAQGKQLSGTLKEISQSAQPIAKVGQGFGDIVTKVAKFYVATLPIQAFQTAITNTIETVKEFNEAFTEMSKVSNYSKEELKDYTKQLGELGKEVGRTRAELTEGATGWLKAGYGEEEASQLAKYTALLQNTADEQLEASEATSILVSQLRAYDMDVEDAIKVTDILNKVSAEEAITSSGLAKGLQQASSSMSIYGNSIEETTALLTAGATVFQGKEAQVARGLNTISTRLVKYRADVEGAISAQSGMAYSLEDEEGNLKSTYQIMQDLIPAWESMTDTQRANFQTNVIGVNQGKIFAAIMSQMDIATKTYDEALNSSGETMKQNSKYMEGLSAKISLLKNEFSELVLGDGGLEDFAIKLVETGTNILKFANSDIGQTIIQIALFTTGIGLASKTISSLTNVIKTLWVTMSANPIGAIIVALGAITIALGTMENEADKVFKKQVEEVKELNDSYNQFKSSIDEIKSKISEINNKKLEITNKTQLDLLNQEEESLKRQLKLLESKEEITRKEAEEKAKQSLGETVEFIVGDKVENVGKVEGIQKHIDYLKELNEQYENNKKTLEELEQQQETQTDKYKELSEENENLKKTIDSMNNGLITYTEDLQTLNSALTSTDFETKKLKNSINQATDNALIYLGVEQKTTTATYEQQKGEEALAESLRKKEQAQAQSNNTTSNGNDIADSVTKKLATLNKNLTSLAQNLSSKKLDMSKAIDVTVFDSMDDALKSNKKEWQKYIEVLGDSTSTYAEIQKATNKLAQAYLESDDFLENLDESTKDYYTSQLELMGVENSKIIVEEMLADKMSMLSAEQEYAEQTGRDLKDATYEEIDAFIQESEYSDLAKQALYELALQKASVNDVVLDFSGDLQNLITYVKGIGGATKALSLLQQAKSGNIAGSGSIVENALIESAQKEVDDALNQINSIQIGTSQVSSNKNNNKTGNKNKTGGKGTSSSTKEEDKWKEEYDKKKTLLDHYLEIEKITEKKYYELRKKLEDTYLTNSKENRKKYQETILQNEEDFYAYDKKIYEKEYENKLSKLESNHEKGKISDKKYYDNLEKLRDKYLKTSVYHEEEQSVLDKQYEKDVKSLEKSLEKKKISNKQYTKELNALNEEYNKNTSNLVEKYAVKDYNLQKENADKIRDITNEVEEYKKNKSLNTFEKKREQLDKQLENGEISETKYWKKIQKLEEKFLTDSKKHRKDYADYIKELNEEIAQGFINANLNTFNDKVAKIEYNLNMDYITEEEYYTKLEELELKYLTDSAEHREAYASKIQEIEQKLYNYLKKKKEETIKELETAISELDKAHEQAIDDLQKELDNSIKNRRTELVNQKKEEIDAQKKLKDLNKESYNEQINLQKELKEASDDYYENLIKEKEEAKKLSKEEYDSTISEQKKLKESNKDYYNSILDEMEKEREEAEKNLTLLEKQEALAKAKQKKQVVLKDGKFQYSQDQDTIAKTEEELKETIETQRYNERKKQIEDLRDSEEKGFEDTIEQLENERDEIQNGFEKEINELENQKEITEEGFETTINALENERDLMQEEYEKTIEALENERDTIQNASDLALAKMDETTNSLINHYNARMNEINELYYAQKDVLDNQLTQANALEVKRDSNWSNMQSTVSDILNKLDNLKTTGSSSEYEALTTNRSWYNDGYFLESGGTTDYSNAEPVVISSGSSSSSSSYDKSPSGSSSSSSSESQNTTPSNFVSNVTVAADSSKSRSSSSSSSTASNVATSVTTGIVSIIGSLFGKHASGVDKIAEDELALVGDSPNKELIIGSKLNGNLMSLQKGTGVVNAKSTKSLAGLLNSGFKENNLISSNNTNSNSTNITIGNIKLPQVKNGKDFVDYLQNFSIDMTKKAYSH